jgi:hypothetical protein
MRGGPEWRSLAIACRSIHASGGTSGDCRFGGIESRDGAVDLSAERRL